MKAIIKRLRRLEGAERAVEVGQTMAELIMATRRWRLEASGQAVEDFPPVDYTGCRTIADRILRARRLSSMERKLARSEGARPVAGRRSSP